MRRSSCNPVQGGETSQVHPDPELLLNIQFHMASNGSSQRELAVSASRFLREANQNITRSFMKQDHGDDAAD